jgi:hypothetical protein
MKGKQHAMSAKGNQLPIIKNAFEDILILVEERRGDSPT